MIERDYISKILKLNGIDVTAPDEEIKSVLISAHWHEDDVDTALMVLRENKKNHETHVDTLHKVFHSDERLSPETISSLLGIDMEVSSKDIELRRKLAKGQLSAGLILQMSLVSILLASVVLLASMWFLKFGIFHQTVML
jgi:hypothetical protein